MSEVLRGQKGETFFEGPLWPPLRPWTAEEEIAREFKKQVEAVVRTLRCAVCGLTVEDHFFIRLDGEVQYQYPGVEPMLKQSHRPVLIDLTITPRILFREAGPQVFVSVSYREPTR
jgi:hypothetical protein